MKKNIKELQEKYKGYWESKNYTQIDSFSLEPNNKGGGKEAILTPAGIHPLVPYLLEKKIFDVDKVFNIQKSFRPGDIKKVKDGYHHSFFHMLGAFTFKNHSRNKLINEMFNFLTRTLNIPLEKLAITVYEGNDDFEFDKESLETWKTLGIKKERIALVDDMLINNIVKNGPIGFGTEFYYWKKNSKVPKIFNPQDNGWLEIGGFTEYMFSNEKDKNGNYKKLKNAKIDSGFGLERLSLLNTGIEDTFLGTYFKPIIEKLEEISSAKFGINDEPTEAMRIIADHIRASVFIINEGIEPKQMKNEFYLRKRINEKEPKSQFDKYLGKEYILDLMIKRILNEGKKLGLKNFIRDLAEVVIKEYPETFSNKEYILEVLRREELKKLLQTDFFYETLGEQDNEINVNY